MLRKTPIKAARFSYSQNAKNNPAGILKLRQGCNRKLILIT